MVLGSEMLFPNANENASTYNLDLFVLLPH